MVDWKFIAVPIPIILLISYGFFFEDKAGDFLYHLENTGGDGYPPAFSWLMNAAGELMPREVALLLYSILFVAVLPYILVFNITHSQDASMVYLYGSQIPLVLSYFFYLPQALTHVAILVCISNPVFFLIIAPISPLLHEKAIFALILAALWLSHKLIFDKEART